MAEKTSVRHRASGTHATTKALRQVPVSPEGLSQRRCSNDDSGSAKHSPLVAKILPVPLSVVKGHAGPAEAQNFG